MLEIVQITPNDDVRPCNDDRIPNVATAELQHANKIRWQNYNCAWTAAGSIVGRQTDTLQKWNDNRRPSAAELNFGAHNTISKESVSRISDTFQGRIPPKLGGCDRAREFGKCTRAPCPRASGMLRIFPRKKCRSIIVVASKCTSEIPR